MNKVKLRAPELTDLDLLYAWENDKEIWKVSNTITPFSKYLLQKYIENSHFDIYQTKQLRLMIDIESAMDQQAKTIGTIDLFDFDPYHLRAGLGILIGDYKERGKNYASLALDEIIHYAFFTLGLHQLYCNIAIDNNASIALFKNHGFVICGEKKHWLKTSDGYKDEFLMQLINM